MTNPVYKGQADRLAAHLAATHGIKLKRSSVLEAIAAVHGARDWNTLSATESLVSGPLSTPASAFAADSPAHWEGVFTASALREHVLICDSAPEKATSPYAHLQEELRQHKAKTLLISGSPTGKGSPCITDNRHTALPADLTAGPSTDLCVRQLLNLFPSFEAGSTPGADFFYGQAATFLYPLLSIHRSLSRSLSPAQLLRYLSKEDSLQHFLDELAEAPGTAEQHQLLLLALAPYIVKTKMGKMISIEKVKSSMGGLLGRIASGMDRPALPFKYSDIERLIQERAPGHFEFDYLSDGTARAKFAQLFDYMKAALSGRAATATSSAPYVVILENVSPLLGSDTAALFELAKKAGIAVVVVEPRPDRAFNGRYDLGTLTRTRIHQVPSTGSATAGLLDKEGVPLQVVNDWVKNDPEKFLVLAGLNSQLLAG